MLFFAAGGASEFMPRQNRVTPFGDIVAVPARGTLMGNRGCLHSASGRILRPYRLTNWIYCVLSFKGRRRAVMSPGRYTELFFLDEATALAAGHRPCFECQRGRYNEFMRCWALGNPGLVGELPLRAPVVDAVLHRERIGPKGEKVKWRAKLGALPVGVMVEMGEGKAGLVTENGLKPWSPDGYGKLKKVSRELEVLSLTPGSVVKGIEAGFVPVSGAQ